MDSDGPRMPEDHPSRKSHLSSFNPDPSGNCHLPLSSLTLAVSRGGHVCGVDEVTFKVQTVFTYTGVHIVWHKVLPPPCFCLRMVPADICSFPSSGAHLLYVAVCHRRHHHVARWLLFGGLHRRIFLKWGRVVAQSNVFFGALFVSYKGPRFSITPLMSSGHCLIDEIENTLPVRGHKQWNSLMRGPEVATAPGKWGIWRSPKVRDHAWLSFGLPNRTF